MPKSDVLIRPVRMSDVDDLLEIRIRHSPGNHILVAEVGGQVVGLASTTGSG